MNDKLKQFIDEHREAFDDEQPGDAVLKKIQEQLPGQTPVKKLVFPWRKLAAAAAILLLIATVLYYILPGRAKPDVPPVVNNPGPAIEENTDLVDPVFARQFTQYREMIGLQQSELKQLEKEYPQLYHQFVTDMNELDSSYQALKLKLPANPNRELLLEAMLQNLQLQSELLNRQLLIIKEIKQKNKQYEKNKT